MGTHITLHTRAKQNGGIAVFVALLLAALVFGYLVTIYGGAMHDRKVEKLVHMRGALDRIVRQAMDNYAKNSFAIESDGEGRAAWLAGPDLWLQGVNEPALRARLGVAISPVRQYAGDTESERGQYFAFTRAVVYVLDDAPGADGAAPRFDADGVFLPCGGAEPSEAECPFRHQIAELPIAAYQAERLEAAVQQIQLVASRLSSFYNTHIHLDPVHELAINRFREPSCADPGAGEFVTFGALPCLEGFVPISEYGSNPHMAVLLKLIGLTEGSLNELSYPWPDPEGERIRIELANEEGPVTDSDLENNKAYPYSMLVRQMLPWPSLEGEPLYVYAYALQP